MRCRKKIFKKTKKITLLHLTNEKQCGKTYMQSKTIPLCPRHSKRYAKTKPMSLTGSYAGCANVDEDSKKRRLVQ